MTLGPRRSGARTCRWVGYLVLGGAVVVTRRASAFGTHVIYYPHSLALAYHVGARTCRCRAQSNEELQAL